MQDALSEHVNMGACLGSWSVINMDIMGKDEGEMVDIRNGALGIIIMMMMMIIIIIIIIFFSSVSRLQCIIKEIKKHRSVRS